MVKRIKLFDPSIDSKEQNVVQSILQSHFWASGSGVGKVKKFEESFKNYIGSKNCIAVNNGSSALNLALSLQDIKNKEVIVPSLTFVSTVNAIKQNGGIPIFIDIDPVTLCIDVSKIEKLSKENLEPIINHLIKSNETNFKGVGQPLRIVLTGSKFGPGIYDIISSLGKDEVLKRL